MRWAVGKQMRDTSHLSGERTLGTSRTSRGKNKRTVGRLGIYQESQHACRTAGEWTEHVKQAAGGRRRGKGGREASAWENRTLGVV